MDSSRRRLGVRLRVGLRTGLRLCIQFAAPATAVATIITTCVHFAVDKLGELGDEVPVFAHSKREVENDFHVDRFYKRLHECAKQCRYVISSPCAKRKGIREGTYVDPNFTLTLVDFVYDNL